MDRIAFRQNHPRWRGAMTYELGRDVLRQEAAAIIALADALGGEFDTAVAWVLSCTGRVLTSGLGKSGHIARKTAGTFSSTGTPSGFLHAAEAVHGDLGMVTANDVVLLYTHSGETEEIVRLFPSLRAIGARTVLVTGRVDSSAARMADLVLNTGVVDEACPNNLAPTTSTTVMLALSDALALAVMDARGFSRDDFARFHPRGSLGKRLLLTVADVMRLPADIALVSEDTALLDVSRAITRAGVGAACVIDSEGRLVGFVSDGDIRRTIAAARPHNLPAREYMSRGVTTIAPDLLALDALEFFQNLPHAFGELPVIADGKLVGLLMLKDLTRSGII
ncbi:MAG: KpsF/GutQ family sugar-phosphate isomerase [Fimbriimonadaceae bacterium]